MQRYGMTEYVDEENKLTFQIKKKPKKERAFDNCKASRVFKRKQKESLKEAIEGIEKWSKVIHARDDEDVKLYIKNMPQKRNNKPPLQVETTNSPDV